MKILYITSNPLEYSSSANMRNIAIIKGLIQLGNEVSTLTTELSSNRKCTDSINEKIKLYKRYSVKLGKVQNKITNTSKKRQERIKKIIYKLYINFSLYDPKKRVIKNVTLETIENEKFDLIISSSDPKSSHLIADKLIKLDPNITKKWIQFWGDPFLKDINNKKFIPELLIKKEEERLIKMADKVIYVSPFTLNEQKETYPKEDKKMFFLPIPYIEEKKYQKTNNKKIVLGYFGDYYSKDRNIKPLYKTVETNSNIELVIYGESNLKLKDTDNIKIHKRQRLNDIEKVEEKIDILICICNKKGKQIPGKIYHYAATNKPILIIIDGENKEDLKKYLNDFNRYMICENNREDINKTIIEIVNEKERYKPIEALRPEIIAKKFIEGCYEEDKNEK